MKYQLIALSILLFSVGCNSAQSEKETKAAPPEPALIPKPVSVTAGTGNFELKNTLGIYVEGDVPPLLKIGQYLASKINPASGFNIKVAGTKGAPAAGNIYLLLKEDPQLGGEGYTLEVTTEGVKLSANNPTGIFRGTQTLLQLLPDFVASSTKQEGNWAITATTIRDYPSFLFRGAMLDLGRHFFSIDDVKRYIDLIAFYKMNVMHLHLSDDQGWRIEIKSWPKLTEYGGSTQVGGGKGGFFTQEQYKDIVQYALDRYITIIPEIDMPGHTNAALASYPELNCNGKAPALYTKTEVGFSTLCAKKDITYKFIDDVVRELAAITPGPYIHLGGDESHATAKDDYLLFVNKVQPIVKKYGKQMIGWEEIAQSNLDPSTVVQYWSNATHAINAVKKGAKIIMSPATKVYLDMKYDSTTKLGQDWAARIEIDSSYSWALSTRVKGIPLESIIGVETPLWTETITNMDEIEYMIFPRLPGIAEIGWSPENGRSWDEYKARLGRHGARMTAMGIDFYKSKQVEWK